LASSVDLPANDASGEHRIATPGEFAHLLDQLAPEDALPWALAGYGSARAQEIEHLDWPEVDFDNDVVLLAADEEAKKSEAARRIVPMVRQLRNRLFAEWMRQGEPKSGRVCPPRRADNKSGCISLNALQKRRFPVWEDLDLEPIGLHDSRHTCATWLDHARVSPKVASAFMGHKAPKRQADAAPITLRRYTHLLQASSSAPATSSSSSWMSARPRRRADPLSSRLPRDGLAPRESGEVLPFSLPFVHRKDRGRRDDQQNLASGLKSRLLRP